MEIITNSTSISIGLLLLSGASFITLTIWLARLGSKTEVNTESIKRIEQELKERQVVDAINAERLVRIETKLDMLLKNNPTV